MIPGAMPYFPTTTVAETEGGVHHPGQLYHDVMEASLGGWATGSQTQLRSLLCSLSILKQKVDEVESLVSIILTQEIPHQAPAAVPFASVGTMIQELVMTASSMMFNCQQMSLGSTQTGNTNTINNNNSENNHNNQGFLDGDSFYNWYNDNGGTCSNSYISSTARPDSCSRATTTTTTTTTATAVGGMKLSGRMVLGSSRKISRESRKSLLTEAYDLVEPDAEDLLAKYTHYCQICGKGFKRDANLRMHMRAHGDEYKTSEALSNPLKKEAEDQNNAMKTPRKYSCPQQGCRWNKNHAKFQPLKSIICVKNHYKRSHCPKMYVCKRCNRKQFSVLSDLRTHEKHCGDRKWQCSCGTTFSRKDKLMGHVALFVGHYPVVIPHSENKLDFHGELPFQFEDR